MAWISVHQQLRDHRKTRELFRTLGISRPQAIGHLVLLWTWAIDNCDADGKLRCCTVEDIVQAAFWDGEPQIFYNALVNVRWLDEDGDDIYLHDWYEFNKPFYDYIKRKDKDKQRKRGANSCGNSTENHAENPQEFHYSHSPAHSPAHSPIRETETTDPQQDASLHTLASLWTKKFGPDGAADITAALMNDFEYEMVYESIEKVAAREPNKRPHVPASYIREMCNNRMKQGQ